MQMKSNVTRCAIALASLAVLGGTAQSARAANSAVTIATNKINSTTWQYNLTLSDASASPTNIGTLWYAWIPGQDYLTTTPSSITTPAGWTNDLVVNGGGTTDGYSIRWVANSSATDLLPGQSLPGFSFESTDPPSTIFGDSVYFPTTPTSTSFTYPGAPFSAGGIQFVATAVPEPVSLAMLTPIALLLGRRRRVRA
jgi:hypothetical protein